VAAASVIRAAGVVLLRAGVGGDEVLLVHRPARKDWSLPKGKLVEGEHIVTAAVRECDEETGYIPVLGTPLPMQSYSVASQPKVVSYWTARVDSEVGFAPDDEVDEVRWVPVDEASTTLTYANDSDLVARARILPPTIPLVVLRHTQAMKRSDFHGKLDSERPLTGRGRSQSKWLLPLLDAFGVDSVHASSARRCEETVRKFAKSVDTKVTSEPELSEERHAEDPEATARRVAELALTPSAIVLCSHRPVLPTVFDVLAATLGIDPEDWARAWDARLPPGGFVVVHRAFADDGSVHAVGVERHTISGE
jgi:8-oxo-dGTP diphosphatase